MAFSTGAKHASGADARKKHAANQALFDKQSRSVAIEHPSQVGGL